MRYRVKKDFVLEGTLLAWGDSLFLTQAQHKDQWEVYSLFTRQLVGRITSNEVTVYLSEDENPPKEKFKRNISGNKSIKDITLVLFLFLLPLWGSSQQGKDPVYWTTKMVQTGDDIFELHLSAKIDSTWFLYPLNDRKKCDLCPVLRLEPNILWQAIGGPELYYYGSKVPIPPAKDGNISNSNGCATKYLDSVVYIQAIKMLSGKKCSVRGRIEYYPTRGDSTGHEIIFGFFNDLMDNGKSYMWPVQVFSGEGILVTTYPRGLFWIIWHRIKHPFGHAWISKEIRSTP